jgi:hypothetical protein
MASEHQDKSKCWRLERELQMALIELEEMDLQWETSRYTSSVHFCDILEMALSVMFLQPAIVRDLRLGKELAMWMRATSLM